MTVAKYTDQLQFQNSSYSVLKTNAKNNQINQCLKQTLMLRTIINQCLEIQIRKD